MGLAGHHIAQGMLEARGCLWRGGGGAGTGVAAGDGASAHVRARTHTLVWGVRVHNQGCRDQRVCAALVLALKPA